jgi:hypothetical protein
MSDDREIPKDAVTATFIRNGDLRNFRISIAREVYRGDLLEIFTPPYGEVVVQTKDIRPIEVATTAG